MGQPFTFVPSIMVCQENQSAGTVLHPRYKVWIAYIIFAVYTLDKLSE